MSTLQERMSLAIKHYESETGKRFKNTDLARFAGVSRANVGLWVNGPTQELEGSNLVKAAEFLGVSKDWLAGQSNKMDATKIDNNVSKRVATLAPVLSWVQAGTFTNVQSVDLSMVEEWLPLPDECTNCFYLKVQGVSNQPDFLEGDYILVDPDVYYSDMQSGDMVVVRRFEDATFKKLVIETDGSRYLQALNPKFEPNIIPLDEHCYFVGQVVDCMRYTYRAKRRSRPH
ncbi:LexA family protein [Acinetobacter baumannii]|uniref:LexA family protein n=1 Tax=Acinetobacter baumannii TaxID=470 RepID=UPI0011E63E4F|nr:S24 family peptidase [Acinetobacter baumannii]MDC4534470.1 helix-turn-helix domain-containing protein [Acinetobacter baumannii]MDC4548457.1 helix-turn-helix domain-containing protein [Acinetobacter baumannii]MDC4645485.1 helix-turn-helix domain-containing protein [Acinetobacter baumannii]MDC4770238.1 helix-turn-helix domain-containing protein [Acinetobacter baumannii]MDC4801078.1 helix-turn-helix domain-containing protein [Acinetobacter baumannii]